MPVLKLIMRIYRVGGAVRDHLLNLPYHEQDWVVVGATSEQLLAQGFQQVGNHFPVYLHPLTHEEYALARREKKTGHGHQGFLCIFSPDVSLEEDLQRRDLTINAIAEDEKGKFIDPCHGISDIKNKILRHISPAFTEDPLRVLRTARFHARFFKLGFHIAPETQSLMHDIVNSKELLLLSKERLWKEWCKAFETSHPEIYLQSLNQCGALSQLMPEIEPMQLINEKWQPWPSEVIEEKMMLLWQKLIIAPNLESKINLFKSFCQRNAVPNQIKETTIRYFKINHDLSKGEPHSQEILTLCQQIDAFRHTQSVTQAIKVAHHAKILNHSQYKTWLRIIDECKHIPLPQTLQSSNNISAIHEYLKQQRLIKIEKIINTKQH